jgi:sugar lactone lactonase YvrE
MHSKLTSQSKLAKLLLVLLTATVFSHVTTLEAAEPIKAKTANQLVEKIFETSMISRPLANFHLNLNYTASEESSLKIGDRYLQPLPLGKHNVKLKLQQYKNGPSLISIHMDGESLFKNKVIKLSGSSAQYFRAKPNEFPLEGDFTIFTSFSVKEDGSLFMRGDTSGKWKSGAKTLAVENGKLIYDVGWVGSIQSMKKVTDGKDHFAVVRSRNGVTELHLDGKLIGKNENLAVKDTAGHLFQVGHGTNFARNLSNGKVNNIRYWKRSISDKELTDLGAGKPEKVNTVDSAWAPVIEEIDPSSNWLRGEQVKLALPQTGVIVHSATIQPLDLTDHAELINGLNVKSLAHGKEIYTTLCATCHGDMEKEGSLPTAMRFHTGEFKNGSDPYRMFKTLEKGYGMMVPQTQYTAEQKYAVIHYIRETFLKKHNPSQYVNTDDNYLDSLPLGIHKKAVKQKVKPNTKPYLEMDYGPYMMGTFQIDKNISNTAQKGIMIRLDKGEGGVTKGNSWILYDHDTMRIASAFQGSFVNWKSIAFDGSHGTHLSTTGEPILTNNNQPAWQNPVTKDWKDLRVIGRDGRRYGPLPKSWVNYKGLYKNGNDIIVSYTVGTTDIKEKASLLSDRIFIRQLQVGPRNQELITLLGKQSEKLSFALNASATEAGVTIKSKEGTLYLHIPKSTHGINIMLGFAEMNAEEIKSSLPEPLNLEALTKGGAGQYQQTITTQGTQAQDKAGSPFLVDEMTLPTIDSSPGKVWMRLGGFDFFQNNPDRAAVCTWQGDVWLVDGVAGDLGELKWKRIATGLFQPLGLKIVDNKIYVTCRDQLARLHDFNGDEEIDFVESFNHDHQVTEHFHEFAMGLQTDDQGNFYYAKSARHAKVAVVPQHGTLLKIAADGSSTEIIATGFRAANGVCMNPDGTWIVTDQEGHWNPKNRINYVKKGGFYGNMYGYHDVTDASDSAMEKPLCWITNAFDRSPAELLWVPKDAAWGKLNGTLLNLSYGYGKIYTVPHEIVNGQAQGGMCALPLPKSDTGLHRGRFHPVNKQLYAAGMFAWAGSQRRDGGFYRIRYTGEPAKMPISAQAKKNTYSLEFSDPIPPGTKFSVTAWDLKRTKKYGSKHYNERDLSVTKTTISDNNVVLTIPDLAVTRGLEILCVFPDKTTRTIHASINTLK